MKLISQFYFDEPKDFQATGSIKDVGPIFLYLFERIDHVRIAILPA